LSIMGSPVLETFLSEISKLLRDTTKSVRECGATPLRLSAAFGQKSVSGNSRPQEVPPYLPTP
jgi:hypothetical protein